MPTLQSAETEPPFVIQLTRIAGGLTLLGGVILMIAANAVIGVCIVLLSALYFALAEIINYLAIIARNSERRRSFPEDATSEEIEFDVSLAAKASSLIVR